MSEELKDLLENEVLSDEVKQNIQESVNQKLEQVKEEAKDEAKKELEVEYAEKYNQKIQESHEKINDLVNEMVKEEVAELREDIQHYANLEVDYAKKLEEFKEEYANEMEPILNKKLEEQVKREFDEVKEDLEEAKKDRFGREIFEAYLDSFKQRQFAESDEDLNKKIEDLQTSLQESENKAKELEREKKINELLENVEGSKKNVLQTILEGVETDRLEERYNEVIDSVIKEETNSQNVNENDKGNDEIDPNRVVLENDDKGEEKEIVESDDPVGDRMKHLAGIT